MNTSKNEIAINWKSNRIVSRGRNDKQNHVQKPTHVRSAHGRVNTLIFTVTVIFKAIDRQFLNHPPWMIQTCNGHSSCHTLRYYHRQYLRRREANNGVDGVTIYDGYRKNLWLTPNLKLEPKSDYNFHVNTCGR